jgi:hypothetical protein
MIYHKWEYGREHDWLAVDKNGYVGYFISGHLNVLPDSVLIPWEYLHNLLYMWIAYCENVTCSDVKLSNIAFERQVEILKNTGLSVWDADVCDGEFVFRKIAEPKSPIQLKELHPFFQKIANSFVASEVSFSASHILRDVCFISNEAFADEQFHLELSSECVQICDQKVLHKLLVAKTLDLCIEVPDMCHIGGAPEVLGPTFSSWGVVRECYVELIKCICDMTESSMIEACDFLGENFKLEFEEFVSQIMRNPLPFKAVSISRRDKRIISVLSSIEDVCGGPWSLPNGCFSSYEGLFMEDWHFMISIKNSNLYESFFARMKRHLSF